MQEKKIDRKSYRCFNVIMWNIHVEEFLSAHIRADRD